MTALILFSHGSLLCGSGEALEQHAERLRASGDYPVVEVGYLNYSEPTFAEAVRRVVEQGATRIIVVPYFLVAGFFVSKSLPDEVAKMQEQYPDVTFTVAEALRQDSRLADALLESALSARLPYEWGLPLQRASLACRPSQTCPLYGTPACPKVPGTPIP